MSSNRVSELFATDLSIINLGLASFADNLRTAGATALQVDWKPTAGGDARVLSALDKLLDADGELRPEIARANQEAVGRLLAAKPTLIGIGAALATIPGMKKNLILHSGPPVTWERMSGPTRGAVMGGLVYEGLAKTPAEAAALAASGDIEFEPCHHHQTVGPMAGIVTASMPVWVIQNQTFENQAYATLNEGLGKVLRYGAYDSLVIDRLRWMEKTLAPILKEALASIGSLDLRSLIAQALQMGDEGHNRNRAATSLVLRALAPHLVLCHADKSDIAQVFRFLDGNDHFFLNLSMPAAKASLDPTHGIPHSTLISTMARNGTDFGIRISGLGDRWFTAPAPMVEGLYLPGFTKEDAAPDIGDSVITETCGFGGFAMAAAPAIVQFVGGQASQALAYTRRMYEITMAEHTTYKIPALDFRGTPTGIDLVKVVDTGIVPVVNTGIAHRTPGIGMVGAGLVKPPMQCFTEALVAFAAQY
jgi:hypothetical protein